MRDTIDFSDSIIGFEEEHLIQLVGVKLGDEEYAIDVLQIQEIIRPVDITVVPRLDSAILGVMNLRGKVVPVMDLRTKFGMPRIDFDKSTRIIVVNFDKQNIGFVVDVVNAVIRISKDMVEVTPPIVSSVGKEYILGICKFEESLIVILDIYRVVNDDNEESNLRKLLLGSSKPKIVARETPKKLANPKVQDIPTIPVERPTYEPIKVENDLPNPSLIKAPTIIRATDVDDIDKAIMDELAKRERETEALNSKKRGSDVGKDFSVQANVGSSGSLDDMIAMELAKRERETEALNKKKRSGRGSDIDSVLDDALEQSSNIFKGDKNHVVQDDLDSLIALELSKREKETYELNKRNRGSEKKN